MVCVTFQIWHQLQWAVMEITEEGRGQQVLWGEGGRERESIL